MGFFFGWRFFTFGAEGISENYFPFVWGEWMPWEDDDLNIDDVSDICVILMYAPMFHGESDGKPWQ